MAEIKWKGCGGFSKEEAMLSRIFWECNSFCHFFLKPCRLFYIASAFPSISNYQRIADSGSIGRQGG